MLLRAVACCVLLAGCPGDDTLPECGAIDTSSVMLVASANDSTISDMADGSRVQLIAAPQGGHILLVGARVKTSSDCQLVANAALRDPVTQRVIGLEERPLLLERRSDGWAVPRQGLDAMPNVAVCPSAAAVAPLFDQPYKLEMTLSTLAGEPIIMLDAMITPTCTTQYCMSECRPLTP